MATAKLIIEPVIDGAQPIAVAFNPNSYTITKSVNWRPATQTTQARATTNAKANAPARSFGGGRSRVLSLDLFFDSTESDDENRDVRLQTDQIVQLTRLQGEGDKRRPPVCIVSWGPSNTADFPFTGTISSLTQTFVLFDRQGRPLRANLKVSFIEFPNPVEDARLTTPQESTWIVRKQESLPGIASKVYGDPRRWRDIADANGIHDPLDLPAGTKLTIPRA